jgi:hypothetical protein
MGNEKMKTRKKYGVYHPELCREIEYRTLREAIADARLECAKKSYRRMEPTHEVRVYEFREISEYEYQSPAMIYDVPAGKKVWIELERKLVRL